MDGLKELKNLYPAQMKELDYLEISEGWVPIVQNMLDDLEASIPVELFATLRFLQIKQKLGELRVAHYFEGIDEVEEDALIATSEITQKYNDISTSTCERCGQNGRRVELHGWIQTLCDKHIILSINHSPPEPIDHYFCYPDEDGTNYCICLNWLTTDERAMFLSNVNIHVHPPVKDTEYAYYYSQYLDMKQDKRELARMESAYLREVGSWKRDELKDDETYDGL